VSSWSARPCRDPGRSMTWIAAAPTWRPPGRWSARGSARSPSPRSRHRRRCRRAGATTACRPTRRIPIGPAAPTAVPWAVPRSRSRRSGHRTADRRAGRTDPASRKTSAAGVPHHSMAAGQAVWKAAGTTLRSADTVTPRSADAATPRSAGIAKPASEDAAEAPPHPRRAAALYSTLLTCFDLTGPPLAVVPATIVNGVLRAPATARHVPYSILRTAPTVNTGIAQAGGRGAPDSAGSRPSAGSGSAPAACVAACRTSGWLATRSTVANSMHVA